MSRHRPLLWAVGMDMGEVEAVALRLERLGEVLAVQASRTRLSTSASWRGGAGDLHRQRVAEHAAELVGLAERVTALASRVRALGVTAASRAPLLEEIDVGTGRWR